MTTPPPPDKSTVLSPAAIAVGLGAAAGLWWVVELIRQVAR